MTRRGYEDGLIMGLWLGGCLVVAVAVVSYLLGAYLR